MEKYSLFSLFKHARSYHDGWQRYFNVTRDTVSYAILESYRIGAEPRVTESPAQPAAQ